MLKERQKYIIMKFCITEDERFNGMLTFKYRENFQILQRLTFENLGE